jgi:PAS domain S-box-containing protein
MSHFKKENKIDRELLKKEAEALLKQNIDTTEDVIAIFDIDLNYKLANQSACKLMKKTRLELEGNNLLQLFPQLTASVSHRHLLTAVSGKTIIDATSEGYVTKAGAKFTTNYYPLKNEQGVYAVLAVIKKIYFP